MARNRRPRLRDLIANADRTVSQASGEIQRTSNNANEAIDLFETVLAELLDGVTINLALGGVETPVGIRLVLQESEEESSE